MRATAFASVIAFNLPAAVVGTKEWCQMTLRPYGHADAAPFTTAGGCADSTELCPEDEPALLTEASANAASCAGTTTDGTGDSGVLATAKTACCHAAVTCGTTYASWDAETEKGADGTTDKVKCGTNLMVATNEMCMTVNKINGDMCGSQSATGAQDVDIDKAICCREQCKHETDGKGFELFGGDTAKQDCAEGKNSDTYKIHETAYCASGGCTAGDKKTCCQKKCTRGVILFGETIDSETDVDVNCKSENADQINPDAYCAGATCKDTDTQCCQEKCSDVVEAFKDTATDGFSMCPEGTLVNTDSKTGFTAKDKYSKNPDEETCCLTKCDAEKGFELFVAAGGTKTEGKQQCAKDLRVHPDGNCKVMTCGSSSKSVCCQQKCTAGYKLKGATGVGLECAKDLTVHATAYCVGASCAKDDAKTCCQQKCSKGWKLNGAKTTEANTCAKDTTLASDAKCKGSPCGADDAKTCCNVKCNDKKTGFKVNKAKDAKLECKAQETVSSKGMCKGDCSDDDAKTCCLKANSTTATTDATSVGLAAGVGMLVLLSSVS